MATASSAERRGGSGQGTGKAGATRFPRCVEAQTRSEKREASLSARPPGIRHLTTPQQAAFHLFPLHLAAAHPLLSPGTSTASTAADRGGSCQHPAAMPSSGKAPLGRGDGSARHTFVQGWLLAPVGTTGLVCAVQRRTNWLPDSRREESRAQAQGVPASLPGQHGQPLAALPCPGFGALPPGGDAVGWREGSGNGGARYPAPARACGAWHVARKSKAGPQQAGAAIQGQTCI